MNEFDGDCEKCGQDLDLRTCVQEVSPYSINGRD